MKYHLIDTGSSRSIPADHTMRGKSQSGSDDAELVIVIGSNIAAHVRSISQWQSKVAVMLELGQECLGVYSGESRGEEGSNVIGFARFALGADPPSNLVEVVRQPRTTEAALAAAKQFFEHHGMQTAVCGDFAGRIIDRLVRPYYNAALRRLDEGLATADDLDTTLKLGLGYPVGPITLLERSGLEHHYDVTQRLFEAYGEAAYAPARRARVAKARATAAKG